MIYHEYFILFIFLASQEDTTSLASQVASSDSGIWSENSSQKIDINHNSVGLKGHYRENSFGGSSGYGSVSSHNGGGARPKLVTDIPKVSGLVHRVCTDLKSTGMWSVLQKSLKMELALKVLENHIGLEIILP